MKKYNRKNSDKQIAKYDTTIFRKRLSALMEGQKISVRELANKRLLSINNLNNILKGISQPIANVIVDLAIYFGVTADLFMRS